MRHLAFLLLCLFVVGSCQPSSDHFDVLIVNGTVVDGSGNPWFRADIGIHDDRIAVIGKLDHASGDIRIDAAGKVVTPGFIDMLGQSGRSILIDNRAMSKISQGVTTEITGEGRSVAPVNEAILKNWQPYLDRHNLTVDWKDFDGYFKRLEMSGTAINIGSFVGATQVREYVIGLGDREPTDQELEEMKALVRESMEQGALGLSTSLIYAPATFAKTYELIDLARVASEFGGIYITHLRDEGSRITEALFEALDVARNANIPVEVWHLKVAGKQNWGSMPAVVRLIHEHRDQGIDITADVYPYPASSTGLSSRIPSWAHDGGTAMLLERLRDPVTRKKIRDEIAGTGANVDNAFASTGADGILIAGVSNPDLKNYEGMRLSDIARMEGKDPLDMMLDLMLADSARTGAVFFSMNEQDVRMAMAQPWTSFCTDGGQRAIDGPLSEGKPHPRAYGSFARILGKYVRDEKLISMEEAVRKMTSLPATRVGLHDRGLLKPGFYADVVVFDPNTVNDRATFENPHQYSVGIDHVLVNGVPVWENGNHTGELPGRALRGPAHR